VPIIVIRTLPEGSSLAQVEEISAELDLALVPAEGLISHAIYEDGGRLKVTDLWETEEELNAFTTDRLIPAINTVLTRNGVDPSSMPAPDPQIFEAHDVVKGA